MRLTISRPLRWASSYGDHPTLIRHEIYPTDNSIKYRQSRYPAGACSCALTLWRCEEGCVCRPTGQNHLSPYSRSAGLRTPKAPRFSTWV